MLWCWHRVPGPWLSGASGGEGSRLRIHAGPVATREARSSARLTHQRWLHRAPAMGLQWSVAITANGWGEDGGLQQVVWVVLAPPFRPPDSAQLQWTAFCPSDSNSNPDHSTLSCSEIFLWNHRRQLSLQVARHQKRKSNNTSQGNLQPVESRDQGIHAQTSNLWKNYFEVLFYYTKFFRAPVAQSSTQFNKLDILPFLSHPPHSLTVLPGLISPRLLVSWFMFHSDTADSQLGSSIS